MLNVIKGAITGEYGPQGRVSDADCLITQDFGGRELAGLDPVNSKLARFTIDTLKQKPVPSIMQIEIARAYTVFSGHLADYIVSESRTPGQYLDSWEVLEQSKDIMDENGWENPIIVAQAYHVGRVAMMASKIGMRPIVPEGLPTEFDKFSSQWWTRSNGLWVARELPGLAVLKATGKL